MQNSVSKVAKARDAADRAVARCNATRNDAMREAGLVRHAGNDVASRDAAALAARDASVRCVDSSLAARQAAARCEAVAEEVAGNPRGDATFAAQQARAAAARCDAEGIVAASEAANAFADSCVAACGDAAALTLAAREAAKRCVLARDDAATILLVARKDPTWRELLFEYHNRTRESADGHREARKHAGAAALAARKAAIRCAAASRRAVSAALVARKTASHCDATTGGDGAATAARQAADRCVSATANPDRAVPRAHAAASEAREAAGICDAALADPVEDAENEYLDKMRGWLMAVATLFVGMAFEAVLHPPDRMSFDRCTLFPRKNAEKETSGASSTATTTVYGWPGACTYMLLNSLTMSLSLMILVLLLMRKATSRLIFFNKYWVLVILPLSVAASSIIGTSGNQGVQLTAVFYFFMLPLSALLYTMVSFTTALLCKIWLYGFSTVFHN